MKLSFVLIFIFLVSCDYNSISIERPNLAKEVNTIPINFQEVSEFHMFTPPIVEIPVLVFKINGYVLHIKEFTEKTLIFKYEKPKSNSPEFLEMFGQEWFSAHFDFVEISNGWTVLHFDSEDEIIVWNLDGLRLTNNGYFDLARDIPKITFNDTNSYKQRIYLYDVILTKISQYSVLVKFEPWSYSDTLHEIEIVINNSISYVKSTESFILDLRELHILKIEDALWRFIDV